jgi:hypothetical protein
MHAPAPSGCCLCGLAVESLIETAHVPNRRVAPNDTARLCILCHRAYDLALMTDDEIKAARTRWLAGKGAPYTPAELHALWATRKVDWGRLHQGAQGPAGQKLKRRAAARRAWRTRRQAAIASEP